MKSLEQEIAHVKQSFLDALKAAKTEQQLEDIRVAYLGRKGSVADLMHTLKSLSIEEKKQFGPQLNELKLFLQEQFDAKKHQIALHAKKHEDALKKYFDVTAYEPQVPQGSIHPMTQVAQRMQDIFISMGYSIAEGPEVETDRYNFEALNIPEHHPARDKWDTLWLDLPSLLLRTHTTSVQIRELEKKELPIAAISMGRCYRHEATDASHDFLFQQLEGIYVDENVSMSNLIATLQAFMQEFFQRDDLKIRVRNSYFPFVEPGIEVDIECPFCNHGCNVCKETEWIEGGGAGLIHPNVLEFCGIDAKKYSGFAFGFGLTRFAMLKYGINDIRLLHSGNIEFLKQF